MHPSRNAMAAAVVLLGIAPASLLGAPAANSDAPWRVAQAPTAGATAGPELPASIELTEADIEGLISVGVKLRELGVKLRREDDGTLSVGDSAEANEEVMGTMRSAGFTSQRLQEVAFNVGLALAAIEGAGDQTRQTIEQYEQMRPQVPPEQWQTFEMTIDRMRTLLDRLESQPKSNLVLAELYQDELRRALQPR